MKAIIPIASLVMLPACASSQTVMASAADEIVESARSAEEVATCLFERNRWKAERQDGRNGEKIVLMKNGYNAVAVTFTVTPSSNGSKIAIRRQFPQMNIKHRQCY